MSNNKLPKAMIEYLEEQIEATAYGEITIELSESKKAIDVVTTSRKRFIKEEELRPVGEKVSHNG